MVTTLAHQLAKYGCELKFEDLSKEVVHEVKRRVIDSLGCALGAWNEEPCSIARKVASEFSATRGSTIIGTSHKAPPDGVAFANAARHGVYSALLARAGMTGPAPIFEGQMGFEKQLGVALGNVGEKFVKRPDANSPNEGTAAMILNTSIKFWPAEYHSQSAIEAALFLRKAIIDLAQVKGMTIESHDASVDIIGSEPEKWKPETRETSDHSLPYIAAIALIDGEVKEKQFQPKRFTDPAIWKVF